MYGATTTNPDPRFSAIRASALIVFVSAYTNLQFPVVERGDRVEQGEILGYLGGGIIAANILQLRIGRSEGFKLIYQDPASLLGLQ